MKDLERKEEEKQLREKGDLVKRIHLVPDYELSKRMLHDFIEKIGKKTEKVTADVQVSLTSNSVVFEVEGYRFCIWKE